MPRVRFGGDTTKRCTPLEVVKDEEVLDDEKDVVDAPSAPAVPIVDEGEATPTMGGGERNLGKRSKNCCFRGDDKSGEEFDDAKAYSPEAFGAVAPPSRGGEEQVRFLWLFCLRVAGGSNR